MKTDWASERKQVERNPLFFTIAYDGRAYSGWQKQEKEPSICLTIERAWQQIFQDPGIRVMGASRTDSGVHAMAQAAVALLPKDVISKIGNTQVPFSFNRIVQSLNGLLKPHIQIQRLYLPPSSFQVRFDTKGKSYVYFLYLDKTADPFFSRVWAVGNKFDHKKLQHLLTALVGIHDFRSFAKKSSVKNRNCQKRISGIRVIKKGSLLGLIFRGDGFLHNQIRTIVGTAVELAKNMDLDYEGARNQMKEILGKQDRDQAGKTAPAQGLFLHRVFYDRKLFKEMQRLV